MKLFIILLSLVALTIAKDMHYHYHFENLSPALKKQARRELANAKHLKHMGVKNWMCGMGCWVKNMFNSETRAVCKEECRKAEEERVAAENGEAPAKVEANTTVSARNAPASPKL